MWLAEFHCLHLWNKKVGSNNPSIYSSSNFLLSYDFKILNSQSEITLPLPQGKGAVHFAKALGAFFWASWSGHVGEMPPCGWGQGGKKKSETSRNNWRITILLIWWSINIFLEPSSYASHCAEYGIKDPNEWKTVGETWHILQPVPPLAPPFHLLSAGHMLSLWWMPSWSYCFVQQL